MHHIADRLMLGTAQFGSKYGITNNSKTPNENNLKKIISLAKENQINSIDTAMNYNSEIKLGNVGIGDFKVFTKLPKAPEHISVSKWVNENVYKSLENLKISKLEGLLIHNHNELKSNKGKEIWNSLLDLKKNKLIKKVGISIYSPKEINVLYENFNFDIIQTPFNFFDRRILNSGWLSKLKSNNVEIHARSIFLQGLLLQSKENLPHEFHKWNKDWNKWYAFLTKNNLDKLDTALNFVKSYEEIDKIIIGIDNISQLRDILKIKSNKIKDYPNFQVTDEDLLNPLNWDIYANHKKKY